MLSSPSSDKHISPTPSWWRPLTHHTHWYSFIWSYECTIKRWRGRMGLEVKLKWIKCNEFPWSLCNHPSNTWINTFLKTFFYNKKMWLDNYSARPMAKWSPYYVFFSFLSLCSLYLLSSERWGWNLSFQLLWLLWWRWVASLKSPLDWFLSNSGTLPANTDWDRPDILATGVPEWQ